MALGARPRASASSKEGLALKVRGLDKIAVDDAQFPDASANQEICAGAARDCATSDNDGAGGEQALLAFLADGGKERIWREYFS